MSIPVESRSSRLEAPAFIDVESGLYRAILRGLLPSVRSQLSGLSDAVRRGDWTRAHAETSQLNFGPAANALLGKLEFYAGSAALLGAALFVGGEPERTAFASGDGLPAEVKSAARLAAASLDGSQNEWFRVDLQHALSALEDQATVAKAAIGSFGSGQLAGSLNAAVDAGVRLQASASANLLTSRMVAFGGLSQALAAGQETWQWSAKLDSRACRACRALHGRVFATRPNVERLRTIITSRDVDTARSLAPWPKQTNASIRELEEMDDDEVQARGHSLPPSHILCRCMPVPVGTVPVRGQLPTERRLVQVGVGGPGEALPQVTALPGLPNAAASSTEEMYKVGTAWSRARVQSVHEPALAEHLAGKSPVRPGEQPVAQFLGGGSGAGKGTIQARGLVKVPKNHVVVDPDELKKAIPEYASMAKAGDPAAAAFAHEESSYLGKELTRRALSGKYNVVLDGTGDGGIEKLTEKVHAARRVGHRVQADYVTIPTDEAAARSMERAQAIGRLVPERQLREIHKNVSRDFAKAVERGIFDEVRLWDNAGADPVLVMEQVDGITTIHNSDLWRTFLAKADEDVSRELYTKAQFNRVGEAARLRADGKKVPKGFFDEVNEGLRPPGGYR